MKLVTKPFPSSFAIGDPLFKIYYTIPSTSYILLGTIAETIRSEFTSDLSETAGDKRTGFFQSSKSTPKCSLSFLYDKRLAMDDSDG